MDIRAGRRKLPKATGITAEIDWRDGGTTVNEVVWYNRGLIMVYHNGEDWWFNRETGVIHRTLREQYQGGSRVSLTRITNIDKINTELEKRFWDAHAKKKWGWQTNDMVENGSRNPARKRKKVID